MYAHLGYYLCVLALMFSVYSVVASGVYTRFRVVGLERSAFRAMQLASCGVVCASLLLWAMFYARDYSVEYIFRNSSSDLPPLYTLSALYSSMEGSHLFWALILSLIASVALWKIPSELSAQKPYFVAVLASIMVWMCFLLVTHSDPFLLRLPKPSEGLGMNALLQNPYMAVHPPALFIGYTALVVPYAYTMAALLSPPKLVMVWVRVVRRWTLFAWLFLTIGIALGGRWAYVELGWGGYWAWDPVENSSFIPWLLTTASLHGLLIQEKLQRLAKFNYLLSILAFFFSFFGTFLTRSGIITSVHSFAESDIGGAYVWFLALLLGVSLLIYVYKASQESYASRSPGLPWVVSREMMMVLAMTVLCAFAVVVATGTLYPIFSEIVGGVRLNVQAPYFNAFAPWLGAILAMLMALGTLMRYGSSRIAYSRKSLCVACVSILSVAMIFAWASGVWESTGPRWYVQLVGIVLLALCLWCSLSELGRRLRKRRFHLWRHMAFLGGSIAHVGFLLLLLGMIGNYRGMMETVELAKDQPKEVLGYSLEYRGLDEVKEDNATLYKAVISVSEWGQFLTMMSPARSSYPTSEELLHEVAVRTGVWQDLYLVLSHLPTSSEGAVTLQVYVNPLVKLVWFALVVMVFGGAMAWAGGMEFGNLWVKRQSKG